MVSVALVAAYRWIWDSDRSVRSKGRQLPGTRAALTKWTRRTLAVAVHCYDVSTINIVAAITITTTKYISTYLCNKWRQQTTKMINYLWASLFAREADEIQSKLSQRDNILSSISMKHSNINHDRKQRSKLLHGKPSQELQSITCHMGSYHTCHPPQVNVPHLNPRQKGQ